MKKDLENLLKTHILNVECQFDKIYQIVKDETGLDIYEYDLEPTKDQIEQKRLMIEKMGWEKI
jgi:hypothetical protein